MSLFLPSERLRGGLGEEEGSTVLLYTVQHSGTPQDLSLSAQYVAKNITIIIIGEWIRESCLENVHPPQWVRENLTAQTAQTALVSPGESEPHGAFSRRDCWDWACSRRAFSRHRAGLPQHAWCLCPPKALQVDIRSKWIWNYFPCLWTQHVQLCPWSFTPLFSIKSHGTLHLFVPRKVVTM